MSKAKRFVMHNLRAVAVVFILGILCVVCQIYLSDTAQSLWWHMTNGNKAEFQGHKMTLPLMWRQNPSGSDAVLKLSRAMIVHPALPLLNGPESLTISSDADGPRALDDAAALRWRTNMIANPQDNNLHAKSMTFYCYERNDGDIPDACLVCKATGTNWDVIFGAGQTDPVAIQRQMQEAREILKSTE
jgi:hypothetical protein